uniref:Bestrophin homolog n=1 Tax=Heterorhabditis bacteriophora TaxID=37862 RepID=A0A1I7XSC7_HETBA
MQKCLVEQCFRDVTEVRKWIDDFIAFKSMSFFHEGIRNLPQRYWAPIQWSVNLVYESKAEGKVESFYLMNKIIDEISKFRHGLAALLKYDWVPVPLVYPQVIFLAVRVYFAICLVGRQFIVTGENPSGVAEALLNPLGEDDDDLECNYVIDKNLITGYSMVEEHLERIPTQKKDDFWGIDKIAPLYSIESAERSVHPLIGSASKIKSELQYIQFYENGKFRTVSANGTRNGDDLWQRSDIEMNITSTIPHSSNQVHPHPTNFMFEKRKEGFSFGDLWKEFIMSPLLTNITISS